MQPRLCGAAFCQNLQLDELPVLCYVSCRISFRSHHMRRKSHLSLGHHLAARYLSGASEIQIRAFLLGCVEPDHNPFTYCKGSLHFQWLRGHNYPNSRRFMASLIRRLEKARTRTLYHWYCLGKLIHYTADAFTYAHNPRFPGDLKLHREYEQLLQQYFLTRLDLPVSLPEDVSLTQLLTALHREYDVCPSSPQRDTRYILTACRGVMAAFKEFSPCKSSSTSCRRR